LEQGERSHGYTLARAVHEGFFAVAEGLEVA